MPVRRRDRGPGLTVGVAGGDAREQVHDHGGNCHGGAHTRPQLGGGQHRDKKETVEKYVGRPALLVGETGQHREGGQRQHVDEQGQPDQLDRSFASLLRPPGDSSNPNGINNDGHIAPGAVMSRGDDYDREGHENNEQDAQEDLDPDAAVGMRQQDPEQLRVFSDVVQAEALC